MQILSFSISSVQSQQEPPHMTHPSLNLAWLFSSSTNIYTHQQSIPPPPVSLPPVLPLTCFHSHFNFMGCCKKKKRNGGNKANIVRILIFPFVLWCHVCILTNIVAGFCFFLVFSWVLDRTNTFHSNAKLQHHRLLPRNKDKSPAKCPWHRPRGQMTAVATYWGAIFRSVSCMASGTTLTSDLQTGTGVPVVYNLAYGCFFRWGRRQVEEDTEKFRLMSKHRLTCVVCF